MYCFGVDESIIAVNFFLIENRKIAHFSHIHSQLFIAYSSLKLLLFEKISAKFSLTVCVYVRIEIGKIVLWGIIFWHITWYIFKCVITYDWFIFFTSSWCFSTLRHTVLSEFRNKWVHQLLVYLNNNFNENDTSLPLPFVQSILPVA